MYLFFLTLDGLAFDHFPLSLVTFTLHISGEISRCYYKESLGDSCQFLFQQQSSLVRFVIMWGFFFYFWFSHFCQQFSKYSSDAQKNQIFVILVKFLVKFMFFFTYGYFRFSILIKFWISFIKYLIDPKFHEITNIWFIWSAAQWLRRYRLLPVYFRNIRFKLASELCFLYSSKD